jgi:malto-oligosyltrehalose trehalohydrolase
MSATFAHPLSFGATLLANDRTRFRLWAPGQQEVSVEVEGRPPEPMLARAEGWFEAELPCGAGSAYRYLLPSGERVPDPASRGQADDVHGASLVVDPAGYRWRHPGWRGRPWHETVLYELHVGSCGGFTGVAADLARLAGLGLTAIELMPVNDFPGSRNWGYDGVLPFAPDRSYGTPDELKALIDTAHEHDLTMFLDVVYNHFGPEGNYLATYAPQFFRQDLKTPWGVAIDFRQPPVRRFFIENALYWLMEYRFDGLRFDAVHAIADPTWLGEMAAEVRRTVEKGREVHLVLENDGNEAQHLRRYFDAQWNDDAHHALHVMLTGENEGYYVDYASDPAPRLARCLSEGFAYQGEASRHRGGQPRGTPSGDLPPTAFVLFLQNHDQIGNRPIGDRLTSVADAEALRAAIALQLLGPNIPMLFMGEELMATTPFQFFTDYHGALADAVRNGRSEEFSSFTGFAADDIPDPNALETFERCRLPKVGDDRFHRRLLELRHGLIVPRLPGTRSLGAVPLGARAVLARWRMGDGATLTIATNLDAESCAFTPPRARPIFETGPGVARDGKLRARSTAAFLDQS